MKAFFCFFLRWFVQTFSNVLFGFAFCWTTPINCIWNKCGHFVHTAQFEWQRASYCLYLGHNLVNRVQNVCFTNELNWNQTYSKTNKYIFFLYQPTESTVYLAIVSFHNFRNVNIFIPHNVFQYIYTYLILFTNLMWLFCELTTTELRFMCA